MENTLLKVEIDGHRLEVTQGTTVLEAARQLGIFIPTLCYHKALPANAACRICIVEMSIEKRGRAYSWIDAACVYPVEDGLVILTNTPKVIRERKLILELLLSRAPDSPLLKAMAEEYRAENRFETLDKGKSKCILCGLCALVCQGPMRVGGISMAYRGIHKRLISPYNLTQDICIGCQACAWVCPTGAIQIKEAGTNLHLENWDTRHKLQNCSECGRAFAPIVLLEKVRERAGKDIKPEVFNKCPECRRKTHVFEEKF